VVAVPGDAVIVGSPLVLAGGDRLRGEFRSAYKGNGKHGIDAQKD